jgi:hypothetical protein
MKKIFSIYYIIFLWLAFISGCQDYPTPIYNPNLPGKPQPVIISVLPVEGTSAGVGDITIIGKYFSPIPEENLVYFNQTKVSVLSATETQLKLKAPNIVSDSVMIKIAVQGAELFSTPVVYYKLLSLVYEFGGITADFPYGIDMDFQGDMYVSLIPNRFVKISPSNDQVNVDFATLTFSYAPGLKVGPDGALYLTRPPGFTAKNIYRIPKEGGSAAIYVALGGKMWDLDFDKDGNLWTGGDYTDIFKLKPDKSFISYPFNAVITSLRIYNEYVYIAGKRGDTSNFIWRLKINGDQLGAEELVFDWGKKYGNQKGAPLAITFSADGDMYVGTNAPDAIIVIHSDGTFEPLYPGVLFPTSNNLCWGAGPYSKYLFVSRQTETASTTRVMKVYIGKEGAPYYGRK